MKNRLLSLIATAFWVVSMTAQTITVNNADGSTKQISASAAGTMIYSQTDGTLTIGGQAYKVAGIDIDARYLIGLSADGECTVGLRVCHGSGCRCTDLLCATVGIVHSDGLSRHADHPKRCSNEGEEPVLHLTCSFWVIVPFLTR